MWLSAPQPQHLKCSASRQMNYSKANPLVAKWRSAEMQMSRAQNDEKQDYFRFSAIWEGESVR